MNTNHLAEYYDLLTARERLPLMLAAAGRGDAAEAERLIGSAPRLTFKVPHYLGWSEGLFLLTGLHLMTQLELAAHYWQRMGIVAALPRLVKGTGSSQDEERALGMVRFVALQIVTYAEGWDFFCKGLMIDPVLLLRDQPGYAMLRRTEDSARDLAFNVEEARAFVKRQTEAAASGMRHTSSAKADFDLTTADDIVQEYLHFLEGRVQAWS